ncbi:MAG TPA: phospholipase D-like domain-containing protein, partial [Methanosarcina sp.]|nr:phospholipase D-like domain-containing protein [Methanosarcina sp.]
MVEFLDTNATSSEISKMISSSKEKLYMVSPYLQMSDKIKILIQQAENVSPDIDIKVLYRSDKDDKLNDKDMNFLIKQLNNANIYSLDNLHAKCYLNEDTAIITSMNLYQHSQENNWEMGIKIDKSSDPALYADTIRHVSLLFNASRKYEKKLIDFSRARKKIKKAGKIAIPNSCYCIRCGKGINYDMDKPLCPTCYKSWSKYTDKFYQEKYCHYCG